MDCGTNECDEDVWDDTALIRAYDKAIAQLREEEQDVAASDINVASSSQSSQSATPNNSKGKKRKKKGKKNKRTRKKWTIGDQCLALYDADGLYYEAIVNFVDSEKYIATVKFSFYHNEENVNFDQLLPLHNKERMNISWNSMSNDNDDKTEEDDNDWNISDICYVYDNKSDIYQQAVINSFTTPSLCHVTFIKSKQKCEVSTSQLHESLPEEENDSTHYNPSHSSSLTDSAMHVPPPPPFFNLPNLTSNLFTKSTNNTNNFNNSNVFPNSLLSCISHDNTGSSVVGDACKEEALSNMLMSWYMSGYHTGYYQGLQHTSKISSSIGQKRKNRHKSR